MPSKPKKKQKKNKKWHEFKTINNKNTKTNSFNYASHTQQKLGPRQTHITKNRISMVFTIGMQNVKNV